VKASALPIGLGTGLSTGQVQAWRHGQTQYLLDLPSGRLFRARSTKDVGSKPTVTQVPPIAGKIAVRASVVPDIRGWMAERIPFVPVFVHKGRLVVGPLLTPGRCCCVTCALVRLLAATPHAAVVAALWARPDPGHQPWFRSLLTGTRDEIATEADRVATARGALLRCRDLITGDWTTHRVSALPGAPDHRLSAYALSLGLA